MKNRIDDIKYTLLVERIIRDTGTEIVISGWRPNTASVDRAEIRLPKSQIAIRREGQLVAIDVPRWILIDRAICPTNRAMPQVGWHVQYDQVPPLRLRRDELEAQLRMRPGRHIDAIDGDLTAAWETYQELIHELTAEMGHKEAARIAWGQVGGRIERVGAELKTAQAPERAAYRQERHERRMASQGRRASVAATRAATDEFFYAAEYFDAEMGIASEQTGVPLDHPRFWDAVTQALLEEFATANI